MKKIIVIFILLFFSAQLTLHSSIDEGKLYADYLKYKSALNELGVVETANDFRGSLSILDAFFSQNKDNKYQQEMKKKSSELKVKISKAANEQLLNSNIVKVMELYALLIDFARVPADAKAGKEIEALRANLPKEIRWTKDNCEMVLVPDGEFKMGTDAAQLGDNDEKPAHKIYLDVYYIDKYEVTIGQFRNFCADSGYRMPPQPEWNFQDNQPAVNVTFTEALAYCQWAGKRLPSEAQWEKAARGTNALIFPWGNSWDKSFSNNYENQLGKTSVAGSFSQSFSAFGCFDMAGNVWEWCRDWYDENYYRNSPGTNPAGPDMGQYRVLRGGSWRVPNPAKNLRSANRCVVSPEWVSNDTGFRTIFSLK